jgi:NADH:ubiquinone oxidoreductase subunit F (NADH-binding)
VIVNGSEGETASGKDTVLLSHVPHLVLDGAVLAARALAVREIIVRIPHNRQPVIDCVLRAIDERHDPGLRIRISPGEDTFMAGEASAVISSLQGGAARPIPAGKPPRMKSGLRRRPVMLSNVETFARLALAARGHRMSSSLVTVSGATAAAGVLEVSPAVTLGQVLRLAGADADLAAVITGGWHGTWLAPTPALLSTALNRAEMRAAGGHWGAGAIVAVGTRPCPVDVLMAIADYLVGAGARQCGPCILGLDRAREDLSRAEPVVDRVGGRGLCGHPAAAIAAMRSGQQLLAGELDRHATGVCGVAR